VDRDESDNARVAPTSEVLHAVLILTMLSKTLLYNGAESSSHTTALLSNYISAVCRFQGKQNAIDNGLADKKTHRDRRIDLADYAPSVPASVF
jgi:hypothetical protein